MGEVFVRCHCDDSMDRELLIPLRNVKEIETNTDEGDIVRTYDGDAYTPKVHDDVYDSVITLRGDKHGR